MTKNQIDNYFSDNFDDLSKKAEEVHANLSGKGDPGDLIQEAYLHLLEKCDKIKSNKEIKAYFVRFISSQIRWARSNHNLSNCNVATPAHRNYVREVKATGTILDELNVESKLLQEQWYNDCKGVLSLYAQQNRYNKILLELYIEVGGSVKQIAARLNVSDHAAWQMTRKMKEEIRELKRTL